MYNQSKAEVACRKVCEVVGMNYCKGEGGWDTGIVDLAEQALYDKHDILGRPERVGRQITEMLNDMVKNP